MATYAIGDVQGCFDSLEALLEEIDFDAARDRLWFAGDLVNRGPKSLETLRWVRGLGDRAVVVLGNHDLNLLAVAAGERKTKPRDTMAPILAADDRDELLAWLRTRPLAHREGAWLMVHAGLHPSWDAATCVAEARRVEATLADGTWIEAWRAHLEAPPIWRPDLGGPERAAAAMAVLVGIRTVRADGSLENRFAGPPAEAPPGATAWFRAGRSDPGASVLFGHWAALGLHLGPHHIGLDTGCVWGGHLTALRLEDRAVFQVSAREPGNGG